MGSSRFYLSLEDDLLRIFGAERISSIMDRVGMEENQPIEHKIISKAIENAQKRVEGHNFDIRKHLLEFDDVMNRQRQVIYEQRKKVLKGEELWSDIEKMLEEITGYIVGDCIDEKAHPEDWNLKGLDDMVFKQFSLRLNLAEAGKESGREAIEETIVSSVKAHLKNREQDFGKPLMDYLMKVIMLQSIDTHWKDHLLGMDHLKEGIGLRGYGQKDPIREYQKEGYEMFMEMINRVKEDTLEKLCMVKIQREEDIEQMREQAPQKFVLSRGEETTSQATIKREVKKIGRNDPCTCGSGKKYKKCCGQ
jgi:preprotein translocase subunit SecA